MTPIVDMAGKRFGRLTVIKRDIGGSRDKAWWVCLCDCGKIITTDGWRLRSGKSKSCGCYRRENTSLVIGKHFMSNTRVYRIWGGMKERCYNENNHRYKYYGGRGIGMCEEWKNDFRSFFDDMGNPPPRHSIDRIDVDGDYSKANCRWSTQKEQTRNMRKTRFFTMNGQTVHLSVVSEFFGIKYKYLYRRIMSRGEESILESIKDKLGEHFEEKMAEWEKTAHV